MEPQPSTSRTSFRIEVRPGEETTDMLRVWNKTDEPLTLTASATSATVDAKGKVALGGASGVASWFSFEPEQVQLPPRGSSVVRFSVNPPRTLDGRDLAAAVTVEPMQSEGSGVAVVQRLATMVYVKTVAGTASGGFGWKVPALIALSVLSIGGAVAAWTRPRRRDDEADPEELLSDDVVDEQEEDDMEHARRAIEIDDPGIDRLYEAIYEPAPAPPVRPKLTVIANDETSDPPREVSLSEEFAWTVSSRR